MADNQILTPSLQAVASPVDRFVDPTRDTSGQGLSQLAQSMSKFNPKLQKLIATQVERKAEADFAAGQTAGDQLPSTTQLQGNRDGWRALISETRKTNPEAADRMVGASPHFRKGLVKAKAERVAMALDDHLAMQWEEDAGGIQSMDDPSAVQQWLLEQSNSYAERMGISEIDPITLNEVYRPRAMQAQDQLLNKHMGYRSKARVAQYETEYQSGVGMIMTGGGNASSSVTDFIFRMAGSESSHDSKADRTNKDGRRYAGRLQFGKARLQDYKNATGTSFTHEQFRQSPALQEAVELWHINDIDREIDENGYTGAGFSRDGLRAVAHIGGIGGMHDYVKGIGQNISDELGTSRKAYYQKFSSSGGQIQARADEAVQNGLAPKRVNEMTVNAVIAQAEALGDPSLLGVLDTLDTGNGPLGNIAWVKAARTEAEQRIDDENWQQEERQRTLEDRARDDARRQLKTQGFEAVFSNPFGDHSELRQAAIDSGNPSLAKELHDLERQLQNETYSVPTNHESVIDLQGRIYRGGEGDEVLLSEIMRKTGVDFPASVGQSLIDDLRISQENTDWLRDPQVRNWISNTTMQIRDVTEQRDLLSNIVVSGQAKANAAEVEITEEILMYLQENPEANKLQVRKFTRELTREMLKRPEYQSRAGAYVPPEDTTSAEARVEPEDSTGVRWEETTRIFNAQKGTNYTVEEFKERFGSTFQQ